MTGKKYFLVSLLTLAAAGILAGCAGSAPSASSSALPFGAAQMQPVGASVFFDTKCKKR